MSIRSPSRSPGSLVCVRYTPDSCPGHQENADDMLSNERKACQPLRIRSWSVGTETEVDAAGAADDDAPCPAICSCDRPGGS
eukprot:2390597-Prorocentrum_lima.AAC.1